VHQFALERSAGDQSLALELTEVAFLDAAHEPAAYPGGDPTSWVCEMASRRLAGYRGGTPGHQSLSEDDADERAHTVALVETLPPDDISVLSMRYLDGLSVYDIATTVGLPESAVEAALARAGVESGDALPDRDAVHRVRWALRAREAAARFPPNRVEDLFDELVAIVSAPADEPHVGAGHRVHHSRRRRWRAALVYAVGLAILGTVVVAVRPSPPPSALEIVLAARRRYPSLSGFEAEVVRRTGVGATQAETVRRIRFHDATRWRSTVVSSTVEGSAGFSAADGSSLATSSERTTVTRVTALAEEEPETLAAIATGGMDALLHSLPLDNAALRRDCTAGDDGFILEREVATISCPASATHLSIDHETGLVLAASSGRGASSVRLTARRFQPEAAVPASIGGLSATERTRARWVGVGPPPPRYRVAAGPGVVEVRVAAAGAGPMTAGEDRLFVIGWTQVPVAGAPPQRLVRVDTATRRAVWNVRVNAYADSVASASDVLWVAGSDGHTAFLERRDAVSGKPLGAAIHRPGVTGTVVAAGDQVWFTASAPRTGAATPADGTLLRIDPTTGEVAASVAVPGLTAVAPVIDGGMVWVVARGPELQAVGIDTATARAMTRVPLAEQPSAIDVEAGTVWAAVVDPTEGVGGHLLGVPVASNRATRRIEVGPIPIALRVEPGVLWVVTQGDSRVASIDLRTGAPTTSVLLGGTGARGLARVGAELWVADFREGVVRAVQAPTR
jgi:DNA-directed RNA polymerase specialized sigma24 family protein